MALQALELFKLCRIIISFKEVINGEIYTGIFLIFLIGQIYIFN